MASCPSKSTPFFPLIQTTIVFKNSKMTYFEILGVSETHLSILGEIPFLSQHLDDGWPQNPTWCIWIPSYLFLSTTSYLMTIWTVFEPYLIIKSISTICIPSLISQYNKNVIVGALTSKGAFLKVLSNCTWKLFLCRLQKKIKT